MTATTLAAQFATALLLHDFHAQAYPYPTPNGHGHKIALFLTDGAPIGCVVVYAGKQGPRYTTNELTQSRTTPAILDRITTAWRSLPALQPAPVESDAAPDLSLAVPPGMVELWVDGACLHESGNVRFGWAYVIRRGQTILHQVSSSIIPDNAVSHRNVAAEIQAVIQGLQHCRDFDYSPVTVCYDYEGLEAWATGRWKANTPFTAAYQRGIRNLPFPITWKKIPAHTGVPMNELVDALANNAAVSSQRHSLPISSDASPTAS